MIPVIDVSLWCPECRVWTKNYTWPGIHDCGTTVLSTGDGEQPDIGYEGDAIQ